MKFEENKTYNGFRLLKKEKVSEINSDTYLFWHEKSGARLLYIANDDDNKVFSISFRTPPCDDMGIPHIIEHSVLCGSKKYPVKEPFVELVKGSLNTFLNAITFGDKTMYPVASRNDKDFLNLVDVYLDAVFNPDIYKNNRILMQEGWHYEYDEAKDELQYSGVVYNEMKGALSSPESVLSRRITQTLYPDTAYFFESGGDPESIPDLTQEKFTGFHRKYYHPSNSYIYLYGDMDINKYLKYLDKNYLSAFEREQIDSSIKIQNPFESMKKDSVNYPISSEETEDGKTYLSLNYSVSKATDAEKYIGFDILEYMLLENPAAPLKNELIKKGIGKDVFGMYDTSCLQPYFSIVAKNCDKNKEKEFYDTVYSTLKNLSENGIDKKLIEASINVKEFSLREADFGGHPKGLIYGMQCMDSWLYDADPLMHLKYEDSLSKIKQGAKNHYFEELIDKYLLNNNHSSLLVVKPEKGLEERKGEETCKKLKKYKESLTQNELNSIIEATKNLKEMQNTPDSKEALETIPLLSIDDIERKAEKIPFEEKSLKDIKLLFHNIFTGGIIYSNFYFDTSCVKKEDIPYISLLSRILGRIDTKNYSYEDLSNEINTYSGGIFYIARAFCENSNDEKFSTKFQLCSKYLSSKSKKVMEIISEIISNTRFDNKNRIKEIILETKSRLEMLIFEKGNSVVSARVTSYFSPYAAYEEMLSGVSFYDFICKLENEFEANSDDVCAKLREIYDMIINRKNLIISIACDENDEKAFEKNAGIVCSSIKQSCSKENSYNFVLGALNEGFTNSSKIQYNAKAFNFNRLDQKYTGSMLVLRTILNYDYLWTKVRVQGGAYGCASSFSRNGNFVFSSYRDPNLKSTIDAYNEMYKYVKGFEADTREITKYIIGTVSDLDTPLTPSMKLLRSDYCYFSKTSYDDIQKERDEVLGTTVKNIQDISDIIFEGMSRNYLCVLGNEEKVKQESSLFNNIVSIFK